jgi:hypothetical protein
MFVSCSNVANMRTSDNTSVYTETNANQIEVYSTSKIGKQYEIIGEVMANADAGENSEKPVKLLKTQASLLGADAIINLRLSFSYGYWSTGIIAVGTAVKFK